ncbi:hypothetical protein [Streptomyces sp. NPDC097640]|uniref:hypothetical protein n=1 Tax=Streptomyces sp. NPDC097640 TaxID=3157229 RepID=UPI003326515F
MEAQGLGLRITEGFSGAPVWDDAQDGVVGMTVAAHRGECTAYLLPSANLVDEGTLRPRCPFQGLAAFTEARAGDPDSVGGYTLVLLYGGSLRGVDQAALSGVPS